MNKNELQLLKKLCSIQAPSGSEAKVKEFLLDYVNKNSSSWKVQPKIIEGADFQDCFILVFGEPKTAIYAHMDSVGYSIGYNNQLLKIGGPKAEEATILIGEDSKGKIEAKLHYEIDDESEEQKRLRTVVKYDRTIESGTTLTYKPKFIENEDFIESCYLDNRLGIWAALKVAENLENGAIAFSCWEEVGGGSVGYLAKYLYENYTIRQSLIADITWVTEGVKHGKGVTISMRDSGIPRQSYITRIIELAKKSGIDFQLEVESAGGSDGNALQSSPFPIDWCFIGAPEDNVHMPNERVHIHDIHTMVSLYSYLMKHL